MEALINRIYVLLDVIRFSEQQAREQMLLRLQKEQAKREAMPINDNAAALKFIIAKRLAGY